VVLNPPPTDPSSLYVLLASRLNPPELKEIPEPEEVSNKILLALEIDWVTDR
jgi:hypothetical protein